MESYPSGDVLLLFFNFEDFKEQRLEKRTWAKPDKQALLATFRKLNARLITKAWNNLAREEVAQVVNNISRSTFEKVSALVCVVSSHGDQIDRHDLFYTATGEMLVKDLLDRFTIDRCPALAGKPKIFIIETCRGKALMRDTRTHVSPPVAVKYSGPEIPESDFVIAFATTPGYKAIAHTDFGSIFIQTLVKAVEQELTKGGDILRILTRTGQMLASSNRFPDETDFRFKYFHPGFYVQISCCMHSLTKRCLLNPPLLRRNSIASDILSSRKFDEVDYKVLIQRQGSFIETYSPSREKGNY